MVFGYQSARDFFEAARCAAMEAQRTERQMERLAAAEGVRTNGMTAGSGTRRDPNGMAATDARIDYERRMRRRLDEDRALVGRACSLAYGPSGDGGVARLLGASYADAIWWRYCSASSWACVAEAVGASSSTVRRWCDVVMDTIDSKGQDAVMAGIGDAAV